jgi:hypothetical protein
MIYTSMHLSFYPTSMPPQAAEALGVMEGRPALLLVAQQLRHPRGQAVVFAVAHRPAVGIAQTRQQVNLIEGLQRQRGHHVQRHGG